MSSEPKQRPEPSAAPTREGPVADADTVAASRVYEVELRHEIVPRRGQAFGATPPYEGVKNSLTGLALSGGGIRSGAFCLGVLTAFCRRRLLPYIDYVSTVSGGGYAGAYLASEVLRAEAGGEVSTQSPRMPFALDATVFSESPLDNESGDREALCNGQRPLTIAHFLHGGKYLVKPWVFSSRHLIGWVLILATFLSGLIAAASFLAWLLRHLDDRDMRYWLHPLGFRDDLSLAFFPAFCCLLAWSGAWVCSYLKYGSRAPGTVAGGLFYLLVATGMLGLATLITTGNVDVREAPGAAADPDMESDDSDIGSPVHAHVPRPAEGIVNAVKDKLSLILITALAASLLPYLHPKRLFQSGTSPTSSPAEKLIFSIATYALVVGIPLAAVAYFARENISGHNNTRSGEFEQFTEIKDWLRGRALAPFWQQLMAEQKVAGSPAQVIVNLGWGENDPPASIAADFDDLKDLESRHVRLERQLTFPGNWWQCLRLPLDWLTRDEATWKDDWIRSGNRMRNYVILRRQIERRKGQIVARLNSVLKKPDLYHSFRPPTAVALTATKLFASDPLAIAVRRRLLSDEVQSAVHNCAEMHHQEVPESETIGANRRLLEAYFGDGIRSQSDFVSSYVVLERDQARRWSWFFWSAAIFTVLCLTVDLNATSWHGFYSNQIANMWMQRVPGLERHVPLAQLETTAKGAPYHLMSGTLRLFGRRSDRDDSLPREHFLFSRQFFGSNRTGYARTSDHEDENLTLANAVAISGAAVSPTQPGNPLLVLLLLLANFRLGQWISSPARSRRRMEWRRRLGWSWPVTPFRIAAEQLEYAERRSHCFITDGGHIENLGIEPLLRRRCRLIFAADASQDQDFTFADLDQLIIWARLNYGIEFRPIVAPSIDPAAQIEPHALSLDPLMPTLPARTVEGAAATGQAVARERKSYSSCHFLVFEIVYPERQSETSRGPSFLVYMKSSLTGKEQRDLIGFANTHPHFPHDSTADQAFEPERFEAYRQLGLHIAHTTLATLFGDAPLPAGAGIDDFIAHVANWTKKPSCPPPEAAAEAESAAAEPVETSGSESGDAFGEGVPQTPVQPPGTPPTPPTAEPDLCFMEATPFRRELADRVFALLHHPTKCVRHLVCCYLLEWVERESDERPSDPDLRQRTVEELLTRLRMERDIDVRIEICKCLSWIGENDPDVTAALEALAKNPSEDRHVRLACRWFA